MSEPTAFTPTIIELHKPADIDNAKEAVEILRTWIIDKQLRCSISPSVLKDHSQWGVFLADLAHQITTTLHENYKVDPQETLTKIVVAFQGVLIESDDENPDG